MSLTKTKKDISQRAFAGKVADGAWVVIRHLDRQTPAPSSRCTTQ